MCTPALRFSGGWNQPPVGYLMYLVEVVELPYCVSEAQRVSSSDGHLSAEEVHLANLAEVLTEAEARMVAVQQAPG